MKKLILLTILFVAGLSINSQAQLSGTISIPGGYSSVADAIADLNIQGVGAGGVTFNVAAGYTESSIGAIELTATGATGNVITFQKSGVGDNPKITRTDAGTLSTSTLGGQGDAVFTITGSDYVVFDGIDVAAGLQSIEYGYFLRKVDGTDGCKFITIQNCNVTMTKGTSQYVVGIYSSNLVPTSPINFVNGVTVTSTGGRSENVKIFGNTVENVHIGIYIRGYEHFAPYNFYDQNFEVGGLLASEGNIIRNFGGGSATISYGIYMLHHNDLHIRNNNINNTAGGGVPFLNAAAYGIFLSTASSSFMTVNSNTVSLTHGGTNQTLFGITSTNSANSLLLTNNIIENCQYPGATTANYFGIFNGSTSIVNLEISNNIVRNNSFAGTGINRMIETTGGSSSTINIYENEIYGNTKTGSSGSLYGIATGTGTVITHNNEIYNNGFTNATGSFNVIVRGYFNSGTPVYEEIYENEIYELFINGTNSSTTSELQGISTSTGFSSLPVKEIRNNIIRNFTGNFAGVSSGIRHANGGNVKIHSNSIYDFSITFPAIVSPGRLNGILSSSGNIYVYNNYIYRLYAMDMNGNDIIRGISSTSTTANSTIGIYYNTIYLDAGSTAANFGTTGLYHTTNATATNAALDMRNNLIINNSTHAGTGSTVAFSRSSSNLANFNIGNNNNLYAGIPGPNNLIFYDLTNSLETIGAYKTHVSPRESMSFTELPPFTNIGAPPYNLTMNTMVPTQTESGGASISTPLNIPDDFFGTLRNAGTPDVGAEEFDGILIDLTPPIIAFTPFSNTGSTSNRTLTAAIYDATGVPTAGIGLPVLYWSINNIAGPFTPATGSHVAGNDYQFNFGAGVALGDVVYYYVVAQDEVVIPNVGSNPAGGSGYTANPPAASTPPPALHSYEIVSTLSGIIPVGVGETYTSLTADSPGGIFKAINEGIVTGDITIQITSNLVETGAVALNKSLEETLFTISIVPDGPIDRIISGNYEGGLIRFNSAERVVVDGSHMGSGRYLTFINTRESFSSIVFHLISNGIGLGTNNITIQNCVIRAGTISPNSTFGIYIAGNNISPTTGAGANNNNVTIINNVIEKSFCGIFARGTSGMGGNSNLIITDNIIGSDTPANYIGQYGLDINRVTNAVISRNIIYNTSGFYSNPTGMLIGTGFINSTISGNIIHSLNLNNTIGRGGKGIDINTGTISSNVSIVNNVIYNLGGDGWNNLTNDAIVGLRVLGSTGGLNIYYNSVNLYGIKNRTTANLSAAIYFPNTASNIDLRNNVFSNSIVNESNTGSKAYSIYKAGTNGIFSAINNNDYFASGSQGVLGFYNSDVASLIEWQTASGQDLQSIASDPLFNADDNLFPTGSSPLIGAGTPISGISTDILDNPRSLSAPTIGCFESSSIDVGISSVVSPVSGQIVNANGSDVIAYVKNYGTESVSNVDVFYDVNGGTPVGPLVITGPLAQGDSALVTFSGSNQLSSVTQENGTVTIYAEYPGDVNSGNDEISVTDVYLRIPTASLPYFSDFSESPSPYTLSGTASLWSISNATNPGGTTDDPAARAAFSIFVSGFQILRSTIVDLTGTTNPILSFYRAYTTHGFSFANDQLEVLVSTNGGLTWSTPLYQRGWSSVPSLGTVPAQLAFFVPSFFNQWKHNIVDLSDYAGQEIVIGFNAINAQGNYLWIDNFKVSDADNLSLIPVNAPGSYGSLDTNGVQVNFTALRPGLGNGVATQTDNQGLWTPENVEFSHLNQTPENEFQKVKNTDMIAKLTSPVSPDASEGVLAITRIDDFPVNNTFATNTTATTFMGSIFTPDVVADRYWEIAFTGDDYTSTATYDIILDISTQQGIVLYDDIYIMKRVDQNSPWVCHSTVTQYESGMPVRLVATGLQGFSQFGIGAEDGTLPVDIVEFNATVDRNNVILNWTTAWEENNMKFDIQRRPVIEESATWQTVGSVAGNGTTQEQKSYSFLDRNLVTGKYEYRLVQIDFDGNNTADHTLSSQVEVGIPIEFALSQNYPNPFNPATKIDFQIPVEGLVKLIVYDISGREVATLVNQVKTPGYYQTEFNGANFASGVYFYRLVTNNNVKTKKFMLLK